MQKLSKEKKLSRKFFERDTLKVAQDILGCFLIRKIGSKTIRAMITDVEAYIGVQDLACHASKGRTPRTEIMYGAAGHLYVYFVYGMHFIMNIITEKKEFPAAVMIRGIKIENVDYKKTNGPAKVTKFLKIDKKFNGWDMTKGEKFWVERGAKIDSKNIKKAKRIGINYAGHCKHYLWRFHTID